MIVDGYPSQDKLAVRVEAALSDAKPELIIGASGKNIHKEFVCYYTLNCYYFLLWSVWLWVSKALVHAISPCT